MRKINYWDTAERCAAQQQARREAPPLMLDSNRGPGNRPLPMHLRRCDSEVFQRLGPNAGGGAKRGLGGCRSRDGVVLCLVAGAALAAAGSMFGVWGS